MLTQKCWTKNHCYSSQCLNKLPVDPVDLNSSGQARSRVGQRRYSHSHAQKGAGQTRLPRSVTWLARKVAVSYWTAWHMWSHCQTYVEVRYYPCYCSINIQIYANICQNEVLKYYWQCRSDVYFFRVDAGMKIPEPFREPLLCLCVTVCV